MKNCNIEERSISLAHLSLKSERFVKSSSESLRQGTCLSMEIVMEYVLRQYPICERVL